MAGRSRHPTWFILAACLFGVLYGAIPMLGGRTHFAIPRWYLGGMVLMVGIGGTVLVVIAIKRLKGRRPSN